MFGKPNVKIGCSWVILKTKRFMLIMIVRIQLFWAFEKLWVNRDCIRKTAYMYDLIMYVLTGEIWLVSNKKKKTNPSKAPDIVVTESWHFLAAARARVVALLKNKEKEKGAKGRKYCEKT